MVSRGAFTELDPRVVNETLDKNDICGVISWQKRDTNVARLWQSFTNKTELKFV